jgi:hypothetical protein
MCSQAWPAGTKSSRKSAAVIAPPSAFLPVLTMSAMSLSMLAW